MNEFFKKNIIEIEDDHDTITVNIDAKDGGVWDAIKSGTIKRAVFHGGAHIKRDTNDPETIHIF